MTIKIVRYCAGRLGVSPQVVRRIALQAPHKYKRFKIRKKKEGEFRWVAQPAREVKALQRVIVEYFAGSVRPGDWATAYVAGSSIAKNARIHLGAAFLLKLDFSGFFESIKQDDVIRFVRSASGGTATEYEEQFVSRAVCWKPMDDAQLSLCIGAPSSPYFSNVILNEFDDFIGNHCLHLGVSYTRYSDDMAFSSARRDTLLEVESVVRRWCQSGSSLSLSLNDDKRVLVGRSGPMSVTGLTLSTQGGVTIGRARKRMIRSCVWRFICGELTEKQVEKLRGQIAFASDVEKSFIDQLFNWYGSKVSEIVRRR